MVLGTFCLLNGGAGSVAETNAVLLDYGPVIQRYPENGLSELIPDSLHRRRELFGGVGLHHELIAAPVENVSFPKLFSEQATHLANHVIADFMPQPVIHGLEVVRIREGLNRFQFASGFGFVAGFHVQDAGNATACDTGVATVALGQVQQFSRILRR